MGPILATPDKENCAALTQWRTSMRSWTLRQGYENCPAELMRCVKPKLSNSNLYTYGCIDFMKMDRDVSCFELKALEGKFVVTLKEAATFTWCTYATPAKEKGGSSRCDHQGAPCGFNTWQHKDALPTRWGVTAAGCLALKWCKNKILTANKNRAHLLQ